MSKSYSELKKLNSFEERLNYLYIGNGVAHETFGVDRIYNQKFYKTTLWRRIRDQVIARDLGCDLGIEGCELRSGNILIHHIEPITMHDILTLSDKLISTDNMIAVSLATHNYIHYGTKREELQERKPNDTTPWKK